jgi:hypothetical protein
MLLMVMLCLAHKIQDRLTHDPRLPEPWHSPERAWIPLMWLIRAIAVGLSMVLFTPLMQLALSLP